MPSSHLILCHPPFLLAPISPSIRVFSNESTLRMRWPKYWSFSFSISPSKICQQIWKTQQWPQDWKRAVFIPIPKKGNVRECSNYQTVALISHASKVMFKILQARLKQYVNRELPDVQAGFRKGRGTRDQIANICWIMGKSKRVPENHLFLLY